MAGNANRSESPGIVREAPERSREAVGQVRLRPAPAQRGLIVELFGPAAAGKTTLARALGGELAQRGVAVRVVSSARPAEKRREDGRDRSRFPLAMVAPLTRASKVFAALGTLAPAARLDPLVRELISTIPPGNWVRATRVRRYLAQLCDAWRAARASGEVVIFDQGFLTSLCSLALLGGPADQRALARGLALVPKPDLLVRIDTPRAVLAARLERRLQRQGLLERLFENEIEVSLRQADLATELDTLLDAHGCRSMHVRWLDHAELARVADRVAGEIVSRRAGIAA